ncbi:four-carbon acid sugar kinase family protein [Rhizobium terrae]|uniref:four-carbon acid sugar kinase family protein n=1 Tax=Rhizobium terrae TaxID=2171756 RepID=UPI000E3E23EC|nr:four-carbon acid sugar kinase family protein [Rhizobium terrae]
MGIKVAIIADDLTGALDTGTPFVAAGLAVAVATDVENIPAALRGAPDILVVNTASRVMASQDAATRAARAASLIAMAEPAFIFKKIDSRLKGNIAAESEAITRAFGYRKFVVAPAIPDQHRFTRGGSMIGRGIDHALPILPLFSGPGVDLVIADAETEADLDRIVNEHDWREAVAVGARGLGMALARRLGKPGGRAQTFLSSRRTLFAIGSRDPITAAQMAALENGGYLNAVLDAPGGILKDTAIAAALPVLIRCSGEIEADMNTVAYRFAAIVAKMIEMAAPDTVVTGGGDTAYALLRSLNVGVLFPKGEVEAGIPWCEILLENGRQIRVAVKSGGFGTRESLIKAMETAPETRRAV